MNVHAAAVETVFVLASMMLAAERNALPAQRSTGTPAASIRTIAPQQPKAVLPPQAQELPDGLYLGINGGWSDYWEFDETESNQPGLTGSTAKQLVADYGFSIDWKIKHDWGIRGAFRTDTRDYDQTFGSTGYHGTLDELFYTLDVLRYFGSKGWTLKGIAGLTDALDKLKARADSTNAAAQTRTLNTLKTDIGIGIQRRLGSHWYIGVENHIMTGWRAKEGDLSDRTDVQLIILLPVRLVRTSERDFRAAGRQK